MLTGAVFQFASETGRQSGNEPPTCCIVGLSDIAATTPSPIAVSC